LSVFKVLDWFPRSTSADEKEGRGEMAGRFGGQKWGNARRITCIGIESEFPTGGLDCLEGGIGSLRPTAESENSERAALAIADAIVEIGGGASQRMPLT
jgi:hypothetical protein